MFLLKLTKSDPEILFDTFWTNSGLRLSAPTILWTACYLIFGAPWKNGKKTNFKILNSTTVVEQDKAIRHIKQKNMSNAPLPEQTNRLYLYKPMKSPSAFKGSKLIKAPLRIVISAVVVKRSKSVTN